MGQQLADFVFEAFAVALLNLKLLILFSELEQFWNTKLIITSQPVQCYMITIPFSGYKSGRLYRWYR